MLTLVTTGTINSRINCGESEVYAGDPCVESVWVACWPVPVLTMVLMTAVTLAILSGHRVTWRHTSASKSSIRRFVITTRAFAWLKAATTAFTFKTLLRHYAKQVLTPWSLNVKLGLRRKSQKERAAIRHYANQTACP